MKKQMENGYIALHRKIMDWEWYTDANVLRLFIHLLLSANWKARKWHGEDIGVGEDVVSKRALARELKLSPEQIRLALLKLEKSGAINVRTTNKYTIVKIVKYSSYQTLGFEKQQTNNKQITNKQQHLNKRNKGIRELNNCCCDIGVSEKLLDKYISGIGEPTDTEIEMLSKLEGEHGTDKMCLAIDEAVRSNVKNLRYIEGILKNWKTANVKSADDALSYSKARERTHQNSKQKKNSFQDYDDEISDFDAQIIRRRMEKETENGRH